MPASFVRLFLVRHAEALANPDLRYLGSRDDPLTERGQWQALQLAHAFAPLDLAAVYTSPLTRAVATAMPIAEAHGMSIIPEPRLVEAAALAHEPHRVAFYLYELASEFHGQWSRGTGAPHLRFIIQHDPQLTVARLALVQGLVTVLASGLALLGVEAPNEMR